MLALMLNTSWGSRHLCLWLHTFFKGKALNFLTNKSNLKSLTVTNSSRCLLWCLTLAGAVIICVYGVEESDILTHELDDLFKGLISRENYSLLLSL